MVKSTVGARSGTFPSLSNPRGLHVLIAVIALWATGLLLFYPQAALVVLLDGLTALLLLAPGMAAGIGILSLTRISNHSLRKLLIFGSALGIGGQSLATYSLGLLGLLQRVWSIGVMVVFLLVGAISWRRFISSRSQPKTVPQSGEHAGSFLWLWLLVVPFLVMSSAAAATAPGFIWKEEGFGYDVLEYHLQVPKEYRAAGQIHYLPHNVYANFPSNVEMLYLHAMIMLDDDVDVGTVANHIHWILGILFVAAGWAIAREWSARAGIIAGVSLATTGWLSYLAGLAYVEHGMLLFGMLATGLVTRVFGSPANQSTATEKPIALLAMAGVFAGLACGCKYTAVACIAAPLAVTILLMTGHTFRTRLANVLTFGVTTVVVLSPWLVQNWSNTGNPVFPLANSVFNAHPQGWGTTESDRWDRGHKPADHESSLSGRVQQLWTRVLGDHVQRFGPAIFILGALGVVRKRWGRVEITLIILLAAQVSVWLFATHLYARFAVVFLLPLCLLAARSADLHAQNTGRLFVIVLAIAGGVWNAYFVGRMHYAEEVQLFSGLPATAFYQGQVPGFEFFESVNSLPKNARVLLVGESRGFYFQPHVDYTVVFNRNPFVEAVLSARSPDEVVHWLRNHSYTHLLVNWMEIDRLRSTYGFAEQITTELLSKLEAAGLKPVQSYALPSRPTRYVDLYEIIGS